MNNTLIDVVSPPYSVLTLQEIALNSLGAKDNNKYDKFISYNASQQIEKRKIIEFIKGDYYEKIALFTHYYYINSYVNDIEKMRLVIKYYPNFINCKTKLEGDTALHEAVIIGSESLVKLLIQNNANMYLKNNDGNTPISIAIKHKRPNILKIFLDKIEIP